MRYHSMVEFRMSLSAP